MPHDHAHTTVRQPEFLAIVSATSDNFGDIIHRIALPVDQGGEEFLDQEFATGFMQAQRAAGVLLQRIDNPKKPLIVNDETGNAVIYLWNDPSAPDDPSRMVMIYGRVQQDAEENTLVMPEAVIRGPNANVAIFYKMSCCPGAVCAAASLNLPQGHLQIVKDSESNVIHADERQLLAGKIKVGGNDMLRYMLDTKQQLAAGQVEAAQRSAATLRRAARALSM